MTEFEIGGHVYRAERMDAMVQLRVVRRLAPIVGCVSEVIPAIAMLREVGFDKDMIANLILSPSNTPEGKDLAQHQEVLHKAIDAAGRALGSLDDEASDYIISAALKQCERRPVDKPNAWTKVWNAAANRPQHADMNMGVMLRLTWSVLQDQLSGFFSAPPSTSAAP